jgi:hypothetical protein
MREIHGDIWDALKVVTVGVFMPFVAVALTIKLLWDSYRKTHTPERKRPYPH